MNTTTKRSATISLIASVTSIALIAIVVAMAWESGMPEDKAGLAKVIAALAVIAGGIAAWFGSKGMRIDGNRTLSILGMVLGILSAFVGVMLLIARG